MRLFCITILFIYSFCVSAETVNLNNSSVRSFVQWYSSRTGKPVIVDPDVKGSITVFNADVNPTNIDDFFKSVLNANGFVMLSGNPAVVSLPSKLPSQMASDPDDSDNQSYDSFQLLAAIGILFNDTSFWRIFFSVINRDATKKTGSGCFTDIMF